METSDSHIERAEYHLDRATTWSKGCTEENARIQRHVVESHIDLARHHIAEAKACILYHHAVIDGVQF
jgi:hypothetical protein